MTALCVDLRILPGLHVLYPTHPPDLQIYFGLVFAVAVFQILSVFAFMADAAQFLATKTRGLQALSPLLLALLCFCPGFLTYSASVWTVLLHVCYVLLKISLLPQAARRCVPVGPRMLGCGDHIPKQTAN